MFLPFSGGGVLGWENEKGTRKCLFSLLYWWGRRLPFPSRAGRQGGAPGWSPGRGTGGLLRRTCRWGPGSSTPCTMAIWHRCRLWVELRLLTRLWRPCRTRSGPGTSWWHPWRQPTRLTPRCCNCSPLNPLANPSMECAGGWTDCRNDRGATCAICSVWSSGSLGVCPRV